VFYRLTGKLIKIKKRALSSVFVSRGKIFKYFLLHAIVQIFETLSALKADQSRSDYRLYLVLFLDFRQAN
jgi:hypothetical protein